MEYPVIVEQKDGVWRALNPALADLSAEGASRFGVRRRLCIAAALTSVRYYSKPKRRQRTHAAALQKTERGS